MSPSRNATDVLVIGSGIAGLSAALHASVDNDVTLLTKGALAESNTWYAQGGIAGAVGEADSVELHVADTLVVGHGLCDERVVRAVVGEAPEALEALLGFGVRFDGAEDGGIALAREGGHSLPRVLHSGDRTGAAIQSALTDTLLGRGRIRVEEHRFLADLIVEGGRCTGARVLDTRTGELETYEAGAVVLATGGFGQVFRVTTNPLVATGDGVAAAWRAGAQVADMEFVQFHPTALDHESAPRFLVSEALRGEGAYLLDCDHRRFMLDAHPLAELAPRDVVSAEIERVMARCGRTNVWLDARHLGESFLRARFPNIWAACLEAGHDLSRDLVPVAPAAHYAIGGVRVDLDGRSSIPGLYASGEVAATGLHGANRLASNSLLEALVFSRRIVRALGAGRFALPSGVTLGALDDAPAVDAGGAGLHDVQALCSSAVGMARDADALAGAATRLEAVRQEADARVASDPAAGRAARELADVATVASLIARSAWLRTESRGCHVRIDHPERDDRAWLGHTVMRRGEPERFVRVGAEDSEEL